MTSWDVIGWCASQEQICDSYYEPIADVYLSESDTCFQSRPAANFPAEKEPIQPFELATLNLVNAHGEAVECALVVMRTSGRAGFPATSRNDL